MSDEKEVYIVAGCRTPIGSLSGVYKSTPAHELGSAVIKAALQKANIKPENVQEVIMGQVLTGGQGPNPARLASLRAGIPNKVPAFTVNMLCGSGLKSVYLGFQSIKSGEASIVVAGGQENMSMAQHSALLRNPLKFGHAQFTDNILTDGLIDPNLFMQMGDTAEHLAQKFYIKRDKQDKFAHSSQSKTAIAQEHSFFSEELIPVEARGPKDFFTVLEDEYPKPDTTLEALSKLRPVFKGSTERSVTAGNASGINDGAAAVILCNGAELKKLPSGQAIARIVGFAQHGLAPEDMGIGPIEAIRTLLRKVGWCIDTIDLYEINEAFAVQSLIIQNELRIPDEKLNISGGAIALGHPIGCSGTRILVTLIHNMRRLSKNRGIAALCIGGGMGIAVAVERC